MTHKKLFAFGSIICLMLLAACTGASREDTQVTVRSAGAAEPALPVQSMDADMAVTDAAFYGEESMITGEAAQVANQPAINQIDRFIIRTASLSLYVADTEKTLADITHLAEQSGGWVVSGNIYQYNEDAKSGDITIRIPATGFNSALEALKGMAVEVQSENVSGQDVTEEYVDLEARLANLEATAERVRSFLDDAITVEDALHINQELSRLEGDIEVIKGRMQYLSQSAAFSTISITLTPDIATRPVQVGGWRPQGTAKEALGALISTLQSLATFAIWLVIYILPVALLIGVPTWLAGRFIWRRWRRQTISQAESPAAVD